MASGLVSDVPVTTQEVANLTNEAAKGRTRSGRRGRDPVQGWLTGGDVEI